MTRVGVIGAALLGATACSAPPYAIPPLEGFPPQVSGVLPKASATVAQAPRASAKPAPAVVTKVPRSLALGQSTVALPAGRHAIEVKCPKGSYVSLGVLGAQGTVASFDVAGRGALRRLHVPGATGEDGKLPRFASFETRSAEGSVMVVIDASAPVKLVRVSADTGALDAPSRRDLKLGRAKARPLIGLPFPIGRRAGYVLQHPHRYQFVRADVAKALREAFKQTAIRFRRNRIAIGDISQWNGDRPASDRDSPRHISHHEGRDIDIGLPARDDGGSTLRRHCEGVLVEKDELRCAPGSVRGFDAMRLAYFLGLLIDGPTPGGRHIPNPKRRPGPIVEVETIFTDEAYIDAVRKALKKLRRKRWIHDEAFGALGEDGVLRPSPWHVDHVHIRFAGEPAAVPLPLRKPKPAQPLPK